MTSPSDALADKTVVFFDGDCNLCNGAVNFLIDHDPLSHLRFASLQSVVASMMLADHPEVDPADLDTVIVLQQGKLYQRSTAVLRVAAALPKPWNWATVGFIVPRPLRDAIYKLVAANRSRLVKKNTSCRMPDPDRLSRFLD